MRFQARDGAVVGALLLCGCGLVGGGRTSPSHCELEVVAVDEWKVYENGALDAAYQVRGSAGSPATTWLAAQTPEGDYVSGYGLDVGPGPFDAVVDLKLTGRPKRFVAVLEVAGRRCKASADIPGG